MTSRVVLFPGGNAYLRKLQSIFGRSSFVELWPQNEQSGTVSRGIVNGYNGAYGGLTLGQPGAPGFDGTSVLSTTTSEINIYSAGLLAALNMKEGEFHILVNLPASYWSDGVARYALTLQADVNNNARIYKAAGNNLTWRYTAGGTAKEVNVSGAAFQPSSWFWLGMAWSFAGGFMKPMMNGAQVLPTVTGVGEFAGALISTATLLGALTTTTSNGLAGGYMQYALFLNTQATRQQRREMAYTLTQDFAVFFGDSITAGTGASDAAHRWANLVAANQNYFFTNQGIVSTTLQNTVQNSVATIGGAVDNNGRDTYATRVNAYNPDKVFILYGLNDLRLNDVAFTVELFQNDLGEVVDGIVANGTAAGDIVLGSPPFVSTYASASPMDGGSAPKHAQYVAAVAAVAAAKGTRYIDVFQWMSDNGGAALISGDGVHPNDDGHQEIANAFLSVL